MQHSILDRIYIVFLIILVVSFSFLIFFISFFTKSSLISERADNLHNEAGIIASQAIIRYELGDMTIEELESTLSDYSSALSADIWYINTKGKIVATSEYKKSTPKADESSQSMRTDMEIPNSIYKIDPDFDIEKKGYESGNFHGMYSDNVVSVNSPLYITTYQNGNYTSSQLTGSLLIHSSSSSINRMMKNIYSITLIPCLVIIVIAFLLLGIVSRKIIKPVRKLSSVAESYSQGDFDVRTDIHSNDEIGQLASSMEYMAEELSKLDQYRHDFVSNISHDFRSPLTSIKGYVQAMQDGTIPPEKYEKYLGVVLNETQRLTKLTQGLLDLDHLESYGPYLKLSNFDFIDIVQDTMNTFELKCVEKNVAIYLNNHALHTLVNADKTKIQQIVYNLIDNAIKFTPSGKKIYVTINELGSKLLVSVRDEGIGMDEETRKKVFIRFYKSDPSRGHDKSGTGLGLSIVKEIVKAHNETIEVKSQRGKGTEFIFTLPKVKDEQNSHSGQTEILMDRDTSARAKMKEQQEAQEKQLEIQKLIEEEEEMEASQTAHPQGLVQQVGTSYEVEPDPDEKPVYRIKDR